MEANTHGREHGLPRMFAERTVRGEAEHMRDGMCTRRPPADCPAWPAVERGCDRLKLPLAPAGEIVPLGRCCRGRLFDYFPGARPISSTPQSALHRTRVAECGAGEKSWSGKPVSPLSQRAPVTPGRLWGRPPQGKAAPHQAHLEPQWPKLPGDTFPAWSAPPAWPQRSRSRQGGSQLRRRPMSRKQQSRRLLSPPRRPRPSRLREIRHRSRPREIRHPSRPREIRHPSRLREIRRRSRPHRIPPGRSHRSPGRRRRKSSNRSQRQRSGSCRISWTS